jgi:L-fuculose-phosphate aldolase
LTDCVLPEIVLTLGSVPIAPYATPGTGELGASIREPIRGHDAILLANHGALTVGTDLESAYFVMERLEHSATILFLAQMLGQVTRLDSEQVRRLMSTGPPEVRGTIPCIPEPSPAGGMGRASTPDALRELIEEVLRQRLGAPPPS